MSLFIHISECRYIQISECRYMINILAKLATCVHVLHGSSLSLHSWLPLPPCILMAPKRQRRDGHKRSLPEEFRELRTMRRTDLSSLLRRLKENPAAIESFGDSYRALTKDYHKNFDMVACSDQFAYTAESKMHGSFTLEYADPALLCQHVLSHCPKLAERWIRSLQSHPCTAANPWGIVVGYDEFQPGNKFDFDSTKAVMCLYFNFVEIDDAAQGSTWFAPVAARVSEISDVVGGWSRVLACILHRMFLGPTGFSTAESTWAAPPRAVSRSASRGPTCPRRAGAASRRRRGGPSAPRCRVG